MFRRIALDVMLALLLVSIMTVSFNLQPVKAQHATIIVSYNYSTIQEAINNASEGDTIFVTNGTYIEHVIVNKSVSLIGECKETTIVDGNATGNVIEVTVDNVIITNFTIKNSSIGWPNSGILLNHAENCTISGNRLTTNNNGIRLYDSSNNTITENNVTDNNIGITVWDYSKYNSISRNYIAGNSQGIWLYESSENSVYGNEITNNNNYGIRLCSCASNNKIYHNNFMDNVHQVYSWASTNIWDDGYPSGGNYWSNYAGVDLRSGPHQNEIGSDGIGDTSHIDMDARDKYPLMGPINFFDAGTWNVTTYYVNTVSNSTVSDFYFSEADKLVSFNISEPDDTVSFCRVAIPNELLWCDSLGEWEIRANSTQIENRKITEDTSYTYIYFTCNNITQNVEVIGAHVIPEFSLWASIVLMFIVLTVTTVITKRRRPKKQTQ